MKHTCVLFHVRSPPNTKSNNNNNNNKNNNNNNNNNNNKKQEQQQQQEQKQEQQQQQEQQQEQQQQQQQKPEQEQEQQQQQEQNKNNNNNKNNKKNNNNNNNKNLNKNKNNNNTKTWNKNKNKNNNNNNNNKKNKNKNKNNNKNNNNNNNNKKPEQDPDMPCVCVLGEGIVPLHVFSTLGDAWCVSMATWMWCSALPQLCGHGTHIEGPLSSLDAICFPFWQAKYLGMDAFFGRGWQRFLNVLFGNLVDLYCRSYSFLVQFAGDLGFSFEVSNRNDLYWSHQPDVMKKGDKPLVKNINRKYWVGFTVVVWIIHSVYYIFI